MDPPRLIPARFLNLTVRVVMAMAELCQTGSAKLVRLPARIAVRIKVCAPPPDGRSSPLGVRVPVELTHVRSAGGSVYERRMSAMKPARRQPVVGMTAMVRDSGERGDWVAARAVDRQSFVRSCIRCSMGTGLASGEIYAVMKGSS
jgi:hypothetical protein